MNETKTTKTTAVEFGPTYTGSGSKRRIFDYFVRRTYVDPTGRRFRGERCEVTRYETEMEARLAAAAINETRLRQEAAFAAGEFINGRITEDDFLTILQDIDVAPATAIRFHDEARRDALLEEFSWAGSV